MSAKIQHATRQAFLDPVNFHMFLVAVTPKLQHRISNLFVCWSTVVDISYGGFTESSKEPDPTSVLPAFFLDRLDTLP